MTCGPSILRMLNVVEGLKVVMKLVGLIPKDDWLEITSMLLDMLSF
jgi:hypothetical protein